MIKLLLVTIVSIICVYKEAVAKGIFSQNKEIQKISIKMITKTW